MNSQKVSPSGSDQLPISMRSENKHGLGQNTHHAVLTILYCIDVKQGWPHFLCSGQKNGLKKLDGHHNVSEKLGRHIL